MPNTANEYHCNKCKYKALAFPDGSGCSSLYSFDMYICKDCKKLTQVITADFSNGFPGDFNPKDLKCSECESKNIELWDTKLKPCPKCNGTMALPDGDILVVMYD